MHGHVRVQGDGLRAAATHLGDQAQGVGEHRADCARLTSGLHDPALREGVRVVADLAADVLEVVAQDLLLLSTKVRAGVVAYDSVEGSVAGRAAR